ncbi:MAG: rhodanese-like domain-containing protein [Methylococcales bacterium]|nr:rhodanese-like domain-containing protein [Methylococcales bacterium]
MDQYFEFVTNHYLLSFAFVVVLFLLVQDLVENAFSNVETLSPLLAVTRMNSADVFVIDLRESADYLKGHIEGANSLPLDKLSEKISALKITKNTELLLVCQTGTRINSAAKTLVKEGFEKILSLKGGMQSWEDNNLPVTIESKK